MTAGDSLRIVYAGTPEFAVPPLQALIESGQPPVCVYTQPDRPAGRGRRLQASPVKQLAETAGIEVAQPPSLRGAAAADELAAWRPDLMVVVAYGLLLPPPILGVPPLGCWNLHASLLPRWRGAAPIQRCIEAGDDTSGICLMQMDAGLDTGPVLLQREVDLRPDETAASLHDRLAELGAQCLLEGLNRLQHGPPLQAESQDESAATYARKLSKDEARMDWREDAATLARQVRAFNPWPVAWFLAGNQRIRVWQASALENGRWAEAGTVLRQEPDGIDIACGSGILRLQRLQPEGGRILAAAEFTVGQRLPSQLRPATTDAGGPVTDA